MKILKCISMACSLNLLGLAIILLICSACSKDSKVTLKPLILKGKISNQDKTIKQIGLITNGIRTGLKSANYYTDVDAEGNYSFEVTLSQPIEARLIYAHQKGYDKILYLKPGEDLICNFRHFDQRDFEEKEDIAEQIKNAMHLEGATAAISEKMNAFDHILKDSFHIALTSTQSYVLVNEFKTSRDRLHPHVKQLQTKFIEKQAKNDPLIANWVKHHTMYRLAADYMQYAFYKRFRNSLPQVGLHLKPGFPLSYFDFMKDFPVNNDAAMLSLNYQNYIQLYRQYQLALFYQSMDYQDCENLPDCNLFDAELAIINKHFQGATKNLALSQQLDFHLNRNTKDFLTKGYPQTLAQVTDAVFIKEIERRKIYYYEDRPFEISKDATLFQSDGSGEEVLKSIQQRYADRPIILAFCSPQTTMRRYGYFPLNLKKHEGWQILDTLGFDVVILAHTAPINLWKDKIIEDDLIQDLWHLNNEQFLFFAKHWKKHIPNRPVEQLINFALILDETGTLHNTPVPFYEITAFAQMYKRFLTRAQKSAKRVSVN